MVNPIRVAQVLNQMDNGGIEAVVMNYYRCMDRTKVQFDFYFAEDSTFPQREELQRLGAGIYPIPSYKNPIRFHRALYSAFCSKKYEIVHSHLSTMSLFALFAAWRAQVPIRICHNHTTADWGEGKKTLLKYILRPFNKIFATHYFACGEKAGRWMYGNCCFKKGKVSVIPNIIDEQKYCYDPDACIRLRKELNIPQTSFVIGHVGRFTYQKNHKFLIKIFECVLEQCPNARLLLVGEGKLKEEIHRQAKEQGIENKVIFTGPRQDVDKLYSAMDVFCLPSFYEGMPVVALEAQANGLPCLISENISPEAIQTSKAIVLSLGWAEQWADALLKGQERLGKESAETISYDINRAAEALQAFYLGNQKKSQIIQQGDVVKLPAENFI